MFSVLSNTVNMQNQIENSYETKENNLRYIFKKTKNILFGPSLMRCTKKI